ncbi:MAG: hypothetical protein L3J29_07790 [Cyclobacteriaceae bacterium]|nr:hypothetical protein [Cyclobacteriaceae bacterium]
MFPDWDPGAGDEVFKITNKTINDLTLVPNLKKINYPEAEPSGYYRSLLRKQNYFRLKGRGIKPL